MIFRKQTWTLCLAWHIIVIMEATSATTTEHADGLDMTQESESLPGHSSKTVLQLSEMLCGAPPVLKHTSVSVSEPTLLSVLDSIPREQQSQNLHSNTQNVTDNVRRQVTQPFTIWEHKNLDSPSHHHSGPKKVYISDFDVKFQPKHNYNYESDSHEKEVIKMSLDGDNEVIHYSEYSYHEGENKADGDLFDPNYDPPEPRVMASRGQVAGQNKLLQNDDSKQILWDTVGDSVPSDSIGIPFHEEKVVKNDALDATHYSASNTNLPAGSTRNLLTRREALWHTSLDIAGRRFSEGSTAHYTCTSAHHVLHGGHVQEEGPAQEPHLLCKNGRWHGRRPKCVPRGCHRLPRIRNGYHLQLDDIGAATGGTSQNGSRVQVLCHVGFELRGADVLHCQPDGSWTPRHQPRCLPSPALRRSSLCYAPSDVPYTTSTVLRGVVTNDGALHGTVVQHICHPGYRDTSQHPCNTTFSIVCDEGSWRGTEPHCEPFEQCLAPPVVHHSVLYESSSEYPLRYRLYYYCQPGYQLQGPSLIQCEATTGCWTPRHHSPRCAPLLGADHDEGVGGVSLSGLDGRTLLVAVTGCVLALLLLAFALLLYHRTQRPKRMRRLHNSLSNTGGDLTAAVGGAGDSSGGALPQHSLANQQHVSQQQSSSVLGGGLQQPQHLINGGGSVHTHPAAPLPQHHSARLLVKHYADQGMPPSYEESVRVHRPALLEHPPCLTSAGGRGPPSRPVRGGGGAGHRVGVTGGRRPRHRDHPDNISYQSISSARHSAASMRSWSACDSLGSSDTVHAPPPETVTCSSSVSGGGGGGSIGGASESTNVTLDTLSSVSSATASQAASCRALFGSRTSFDSSSLVTNEGAPLLEEAEGEKGGGRAAPDQLSQCTRDSEDSSTGDTRSPAFSLHE